MKKGLSTEDIAISILESLGYSVLERRKQVVVNNVKVAEIDIVARDQEGNLLAVEVKSGKASVTDIRQVFSNSKLINAKPLLICKGFSDSSAISLASELGISYLLLPEYYLFTFEDFKEIAKEIIYEVLSIYLSLEVNSISEEDKKIVDAIANSNTFTEAALKLNTSEENLRRAIVNSGIFNLKEKFNFSYLRLQALIIIKKLNEFKRFENIEHKLNEIKKNIDSFKESN
ncbi:MAG: YraN family protein [Thermoproteota archaeon]|nr:YraN family protein [Candidatus Brockarchaeota archaeon]